MRIPLRYFLVVLRGVYMKGVGFDLLWPEIAAMGLWGALPFVLSGGRFRKSLD